MSSIVPAYLVDAASSDYLRTTAVLDPIEPGYSVRVATTAGDTARTTKAVADSLPYTDEQAGIVVEDSDRIDPDVMEHTRQSRLRAWQSPPDAR